MVEAPDDANFFRREGAFVVMECQDKVLLVKPIDGRGYWELPGGGIDAGETPEQAIIRETFEETGFKLTTDGLKKYYEQRVHLYLRNEPEFWNYDQHYFHLNVDENLLFDNIIASPEDGHMQWVDKSDLDSVRIKHTVLPALQVYLKN